MLEACKLHVRMGVVGGVASPTPLYRKKCDEVIKDGGGAACEVECVDEEEV